MHFWSKFGNPDFNQRWLIARTNSQTQNGVNFYFEVKFDHEDHDQSPPKTIGILTKVFYTYGPNLVILAWTGDELSRRQTWWRTDAGNENTWKPKLASGKTYEDPQDRYDLPTACIANVFFLLEKFVMLITVAWFQVYRWKCTIPSWRFRHCYC